MYDLTGTAGGDWIFGQSSRPAATLTTDVLDFNLLASEHFTSEAVLAQGKVYISGDQALAQRVLEHTIVLY